MSTDSGLIPSPWTAPVPPPLPTAAAVPPPLLSATQSVPQPTYIAQPVDEPQRWATEPAAAGPSDPLPEPARPRIGRELFFSALAGLASAMLHFALILLLGLLIVPPLIRPPVVVIEASVERPPPVDQIVQRLDRNLVPATQLAPPSSASALSGATAMSSLVRAAQVQRPQLNTAVVDRPSNLRIDVGAVNVLTASGDALAASVPNGTLGEPLVAADGYDTAMDILTREILNRLAKGKVLVVWIFDQSLSMKDDQKEIAGRLERVYEELGLSSAARGDALWTGVVSYGAGFAVHTQKPTTSIKQIREAIGAIPVDESGEELMCQAVAKTIVNFRSFSGAGGGRQLMTVLVSDESGNPNDNLRSLEPTIEACKSAKASVYVLGREAVFGYPFAHMEWTVTRPIVGGGTASRQYVVAIDRGPETPYVELLQTEGIDRRTDSHPSGFGPYEQVRLARETGGMFLMLPSPELAMFRRDETNPDEPFDFEKLRPYLPDVRSREDYAKSRDYNPLRATIWKVINDLNPYKPEIGRYINLATTFPPDRSDLARELDAETAKAKQYVLYLDAAERTLRAAKPLRDREKEPRWRAHYDLILAQLVAYKARVYEYGSYLAMFKANPKPTDPPTPNRALRDWQLSERRQTTADKITRPLIEEAEAMFRTVIKEYYGTPWATRADYELSRSYGYELFPRYFNPNPPPGNRRQLVTPFAPPKI